MHIPSADPTGVLEGAGGVEDRGTAVRVAIVNDYSLVVAGIARMLEPFSGRVEVCELDSRTSVLREVDVILYDTFAQVQGDNLPEVSELSSTGTPRLVIFTWNIGPEIQARTRRAGGAGLVSKSLTAAELVSVIERVHRGELVFGEAGHDPTPPEVRAARWPGEEHGLSARESEVLALICQGLSNAEIGLRAYLGINTIKTYIRSAYRKIGVTTRSQAVRWAMTHGFRPDVLRLTLAPPGS